VNAKHRDEPISAAERYGKHSEANAPLPVVEILRHAVERGEAIRLAWSGGDSNTVVSDSQEFPTAVLPVIRSTDDMPNAFAWWPKRLAG
jgi:hypothetical protein